MNKKVGVRTYVGEFDFSKAYFLNKYLQTGDEKLIDTVFSDWVKDYAQWANKDFQQKIRNIRELNKTLPANKQIHFVGIDEIHNDGLAADYFTEVLSTKKYQPLQSHFQKLIGLLQHKEKDSLIAIEAENVLTAITKSGKVKLSEEGDAILFYPLFVCKEAYTKGREAALFRNFKYLYKQLHWDKEKLYGFWGFTHVLQAKVNGEKLTPFAAQLIADSDLKLKGKVVSVSCMYSGSKMMLPTPFLPPFWQEQGKRYSAVDKFNNDGEMMKTNNMEVFKQYTVPNSATLFKVAGQNSPFNQQKIEVQYSSFMPPQQQLFMNEEGKYMTDYFQYIILIRNSPATTPILN